MVFTFSPPGVSYVSVFISINLAFPITLLYPRYPLLIPVRVGSDIEPGVLTTQKLAKYVKLSNQGSFFCLYFSSPEITGVWYHAQIFITRD